MRATFGAEIIIYEPTDEIVDKIIEELNERKIIEVSGSFLPNGHVEMDVTRYENARDIGFIFKPTNGIIYHYWGFKVHTAIHLGIIHPVNSQLQVIFC